MGESEGEEDCVFLGTPFTSDEEEGVFQTRSRKVDPRNLPVRDQQGRVRFHGAFTGGFSAGYFNTVGSKEGWTPSTFRSSRAEKAEEAKSGDGGQRPEDFMDDEDLGEFGIAPKQLVATQDFSLGKTTTAAPKFGKTIGGEVPADLIAPAPDPIGVRLLQSMGWRPGQGVGPRLTAAQLKKRRKRKRMARGGEGGEGGGGGGGEERGEADDEEGEEDVEMSRHTFAPRYVETVEYKPKNDVFGIGYSALADPTALLFAPQDRQAAGRLNMSDVIAGRQQQSRTARRGLSGMVDDDDDIYDGDNMGNYDRVLGASDKIVKEAMKHPSLEPPVPDKMELCSDGRPVIVGFSLATLPTEIGKWFPGPTVPQGWKPFQDIDQQVPEAKKDPAAAKNFTAAERGAMIGEDQSDRSVFAFLGPKDKERIMAAASQAKGATSGLQFQQRPPLTGANASALTGAKRHEPPPAPKLQDSGDWVKSALDRLISEAKTKAAFVQESGKLNLQGPQPVPTPTTRAPEGPTDLHPKFKEQLLACTVASAALRGNFKPFPTNPAKQARYETFLKIQVDLGATEPNAGAKPTGGFFIDTKGGSGLTEWEAQQELEEFIKAAQMYRPMSTAMSSRFVSAAARDEDTEAKIPPSVTADPDAEKRKAVASKLFGKLTRTVEEWRPNRLLCKRMGVTDPYSGEGQAAVAAAGAKKPPPRELASLQFLPVPASVDVGGSEGQKTTMAAEEPKKGSESKEQPPARPPMDLFKAIFEDKSSESSSSESENESDKEDGGKRQNRAETLAPPKPVDLLSAALAKNPTPIAPLPAHLSSQPAPVIPQIPQQIVLAAPQTRGAHIGVPIFAANASTTAPIKREKVEDVVGKSSVGLVMPTKKTEPGRVSGHGSDDEPFGPLWNVPPPPPAEKEERAGSPVFMLGALKGLSERGIVFGPQPPPASTNSNTAKQMQPIKSAQHDDSSDEWVSNDESGDSKKRKRKHKEKKAKRDSKGGKTRKKEKSKEKKKKKRKECDSFESESSSEDERRKKKRRKKEGKEKKSKERKSKKRKVSESSSDSSGSSEGESTEAILKKLKGLSSVQKQSVVKTLKGDR